MNIHLDNYALVRALALGLASLHRRQMWTRGAGHYANTLRSHFVGRVGEIAAEAHARRLALPYRANFYYPDREGLCDLEITEPRCRVEVKTWSRAYWERLGRAVSAGQLAAVKERADVVWWMVVGEVPLDPYKLIWWEGVDVALAGWSWVEDIEAAGVVAVGMPGREAKANYQVAAEALREFRIAPLSPPIPASPRLKQTGGGDTYERA